MGAEPAHYRRGSSRQCLCAVARYCRSDLQVRCFRALALGRAARAAGPLAYLANWLYDLRLAEFRGGGRPGAGVRQILPRRREVAVRQLVWTRAEPGRAVTGGQGVARTARG